jgi:hypothetical protein
MDGIAGDDGRGAISRAYSACLNALGAMDIATVLQFRDAVIRLTAHARRQRNVSALRQCEEIRIRLERRWGQLYGMGAKARAGRPSSTNATDDRGAPSLAELGVSYSQSWRRQALAALSEREFETTLAHPLERAAPFLI